MIRVKAYFSASIRGKASKGKPFTESVCQADIDANILAARRMAAKLRCYFGEILDLYVPHDQDQLIQTLWRKGVITPKDILDGDLDLIKDVEILIVWKREGIVSGGMQYEIVYAEDLDMVIVYFERFTERFAMRLLDIIYNLAKAKQAKMSKSKKDVL